MSRSAAATVLVSVKINPWLCVGLVALTGCSPALTSMEPARLVPPRHLQLTTGLYATNPTGDVRAAFDTATQMQIGNDGITADQITTLMNGAAAVVVAPPSVGMEVGLAYGVTRGFAVGVRTTGNTVRANLRFQFLRLSPGFYGSIGIGGTAYLYGFPIQQFTDQVSLNHFARQEVDVPISFGWSGRYGHIWFGPKMVLSHYNADVSACAQTNDSSCVMTANIGVSGTAAYFGGQLGLAVGYRQYWVAAELTVMHIQTRANVDLELNGNQAHLSFGSGGLVMTPGIAFLGWF